MSLSSQPHNRPGLDIRRSFNFSRDLYEKLSSIFYLDYLFSMKSLKPKFNGKIISKINPEIIIRNIFKHLQSNIKSIFVDNQSSSRSGNYVSFFSNIISPNGMSNHIVYLKTNFLETFKDNIRFSFIREHDLTTYSFRNIDFNHSMTFICYLNEKLRYLINQNLLNIPDPNFQIEVKAHYPNMQYNTMLPNQCASLSYTVQRPYFSRSNRFNSIPTSVNFNSSGKQIAESVILIPQKLKLIDDSFREVFDSFTSTDFIIDFNGIEFNEYCGGVLRGVIGINQYLGSFTPHNIVAMASQILVIINY